MLKLVNRTRSPGSRFTFCADLRSTLPARIPPPPLLPNLFSSLFFLRSCLPVEAPPSPDCSAAPTMEDSHCLRGLSLPSIAKYTPARVHPTTPPPPPPSSLPRPVLPYVRSLDASSLMLRLQLGPSHSARFPYETYGDHVRS